MKRQDSISHNWQSYLKETLDSVDMPHNIFWDLVSEITDDWSFIIKLGSVIEVILQKYLSKSLPEGMEKTIDDFGFAKKLEVAKDLKMISNDQYHLFRWIKNQRNSAAHNFSYSFENYLAQESNKGYKNNQETFYKLFRNTFSKEWLKNIGVPFVDEKKFLLENPRITVFFSVLQPIALIHVEFEHKKIVEDHISLKEKYDYLLSTLKEMFSN
ncbi:hypothetical protein [Halobacteriovorax sp. DPLXC-1]|uniref:hypothetical protein n=1 Tax=Halobacteriovorax sp. DPLXC-1 TaxID=3110771 RepID=UPI002FEF3844